MAEQSSKHGPVRDEYLAEHEDGEDERPGGRLDRPGLAAGLSEGVRESRSDIARFLGISAFPAEREGLAEVAARNGAPDEILERFTHLPAGQRFHNVEDVIEALGLHGETKRF